MEGYVVKNSKQKAVHIGLYNSDEECKQVLIDLFDVKEIVYKGGFSKRYELENYLQIDVKTAGRYFYAAGDRAY
jgi:hypothetical protein